MTDQQGSENNVGIFAIKNEVIDSILDHFHRENLQVSYVQMAPMALYNYVMYDCPELADAENQAIIVIDVGAENTDLVVCTSSTVWQRCVHLGGNAFTRAIADSFKLSFQKAEKLKRTAPMSKYARQIFQAMRPVYTDLASEVQRSLNFYTSSNPDTKLLKAVAMGGGTKMRGLLKYLRQTLQIPVEKPDSFKKLTTGPGVSAAKFHENASDFGVVYGLALQGLGLATIDSNLLPRSVARSMAWVGKAKYFTVAACALLLVSFMCFARSSLDRMNYHKNDHLRAEIAGIIDHARQASEELGKYQNQGGTFKARIEKAFKPFGCRDVVPRLYQTIVSVLPNAENNPDQAEIYKAFAAGDAGTVMQTERKERKQIFITGMSAHFVDNLEVAELGESGLVLTAGMEEDGLDSDEEREAREREALGIGESRFARKKWDFGGAGEATAEQVHAGFVVTIEGYCPYKNIGQLLDPPGAEDDRSRWGIVTRLMHLDDIADGNSAFKLYEKAPKHFKLETDVLDVASKHPLGVGIRDQIAEKSADKRNDVGAEDILRDPMTKEVISRVAKRNEEGDKVLDNMGNIVHEENDSWFVLQFKVIWKDAPDVPGGGASGAGGAAGRARATPGSKFE
jgi:type IV pilus assembly protein PilM